MTVNKKLLMAFKMLCWAFYFVSIFVLTLLALDVFTLPYLTPFAHVLKTIISPLVPLMMPFFLGVAIKLYKHTPFPSRNQWLFTAGISIFQQMLRVFEDFATLYEWKRLGNGKGPLGMGLEVEGLCGLGSCTANWVEAILIFAVVIGEVLGWDWDRGYLQKFIDHLAMQSIKEEQENIGRMNIEKIEKGEMVKQLQVGEGLDVKTKP